VGFWGTFVVHRGPRSLAQLFADLKPLSDAEESGGAVDGWAVTRAFDSDGELPEDFVTRLRDATAAPALTVRILDSSAGYVCAAGVTTPSWQAWLCLGAACGYLSTGPSPFDDEGNYLGPDWVDPEHEAANAALKERLLSEAPGGMQGAASAVAWAREAGLTPGSIEAIAAVLDRDDARGDAACAEFLELLGVLAEPALN
jgi:hypothetical protein